MSSNPIKNSSVRERREIVNALAASSVMLVGAAVIGGMIAFLSA